MKPDFRQAQAHSLLRVTHRALTLRVLILRVLIRVRAIRRAVTHRAVIRAEAALTAVRLIRHRATQVRAIHRVAIARQAAAIRAQATLRAAILHRVTLHRVTQVEAAATLRAAIRAAHIRVVRIRAAATQVIRAAAIAQVHEVRVIRAAHILRVATQARAAVEAAVTRQAHIQALRIRRAAIQAPRIHRRAIRATRAQAVVTRQVERVKLFVNGGWNVQPPVFINQTRKVNTMNETVESIFTQMFAPAEIPLEVKVLYEKVRFYSDRIDQPIMRPLDLVLIAAMATSGKMTIQPEPKKTIPVTVNTTEPEAEEQTEQDTQAAPLPPPLGVMDVPAVNKPPSEVELQRLTYPELRIYCRDTLGWNPKFMSKADMIKMVVSGEYLKFRKKK